VQNLPWVLCASAVVMLNTPCSEVVWRVLVTHSIRQFPLHFPSRALPCAITFQLHSNVAEYCTVGKTVGSLLGKGSSCVLAWQSKFLFRRQLYLHSTSYSNSTKVPSWSDPPPSAVNIHQFHTQQVTTGRWVLPDPLQTNRWWRWLSPLSGVA
jgi:hypothetical protein